jgi:hypothetical protein
MGSFPPTDATVHIYIDDNGDFTVKPLKCWVDEGGTVTFVTEKTAAQVIIPDTNLVFESGMQGPGTASLMLSIEDSTTLSVADTTGKLPYAVFQVEEGRIVGGLERAPVIIIVKTSRM